MTIMSVIDNKCGCLLTNAGELAYIGEPLLLQHAPS